MKRKINFKEFVNLIIDLGTSPEQKSLMRVKVIDFFTEEVSWIEAYTTLDDRLHVLKDGKELWNTPLKWVELYETINTLSLYLECDYHSTYYLTILC